MRPIFTANNYVEAELIAQSLKNEGIDAQVEVHCMDGITDHPVVLVDDSQVEEALKLIKGETYTVEKSEGEKVEMNEAKAPEHPVKSTLSSFWKGFLSASAVFLLIGFFYYASYSHRPKDLFSNEVDSNQDGKPDYWIFNDGGKLIRTESDSNFDGKVDTWTFYEDMHTYRQEVDNNLDGKPDRWVYIKLGSRIKEEDDFDFDGKKDGIILYESNMPSVGYVDNDGDGKHDEVIKYEQGRVVERKWSYNNDDIFDKKEIFFNGRKIKEMFDYNRDGKYEKVIDLDVFERPITKK